MKRLYHTRKFVRLRTLFPMSLSINNLSVSISNREILHKISLEIFAGKIHVLMGPNGSGKSTLAGTIMGNTNYEVRSMKYELSINGKDISKLKPEERSGEGLFLAFQNPTAIPGVSIANLLKIAYQLRKLSNQPINQSTNKQIKMLHNPALSVWEFNEMLVKQAKTLGIPQEFLRRGLNDQFSGGEKKKLEMLQALILSPKYAIFDEIDTGLDVDALRTVASGIGRLKNGRSGILLITHYQRILKYVKPDYVHILVGGKIVEFGDYKLAQEVERNGYKKWLKLQ